jgi:hypothetical protein
LLIKPIIKINIKNQIRLIFKTEGVFSGISTHAFNGYLYFCQPLNGGDGDDEGWEGEKGISENKM